MSAKLLPPTSMTDAFASESSAPRDISAETSQRVGDVTGTLAELERKLRELEQELTSIGRRRAFGEETPAPVEMQSPDPAGASPAPPQGTPPQGTPPQATPPEATPAYETPAYEHSPQAAPAPESTFLQPSGRLVDEAIEPAPVQELERVRPSETQLASLAELRRFRDRLERFGRELATEYDALLGRVMTGLSSTPAGLSSAPGPASPAAPSQAGPSAAAAPSPEAAAAESRENALFEGRIELGVGPFYDIGSLGAFEQRLAGLPGVSEASVRRFEASHAVVDVRLATPIALVRELRRAVESDFSVREVASGRILLTFDDV
jgi:hypothetical protein